MFFIDDATGEAPSFDFGVDGAQTEGDEDGEIAVDSVHEGSESDEDSSVSPDGELPAPVPGPSRKAPAWVDPDDASLTVSLASNTRLRKLRDALAEDEVNGKDYERKLRRQFEKINPTPDWANKARAKLRPSAQKRRRTSYSSDGESVLDDDSSDLLTSTGGILGERPRTLQQGTLAIERLRDANISAPSEGLVKAVQFHPSTQVPVMLTASEDRRLRLFNVSRCVVYMERATFISCP